MGLEDRAPKLVNAKLIWCVTCRRAHHRSHPLPGRDSAHLQLRRQPRRCWPLSEQDLRDWEEESVPQHQSCSRQLREPRLQPRRPALRQELLRERSEPQGRLQLRRCSDRGGSGSEPSAQHRQESSVHLLLSVRSCHGEDGQNQRLDRLTRTDSPNLLEDELDLPSSVHLFSSFDFNHSPTTSSNDEVSHLSEKVNCVYIPLSPRPRRADFLLRTSESLSPRGHRCELLHSCRWIYARQMRQAGRQR